MVLVESNVFVEKYVNCLEDLSYLLAGAKSDIMVHFEVSKNEN